VIERPSWSVVVASFRRMDLLAQCLESIRPQCARIGAELVVARAAATDDEFLSDSAGCRSIRLPAGAGLPEIRGLGLAHAKGDWIALTEDHCVADAAWLDALSAAASPDVQVLGGSMGNARRTRGTDCGAFLAEYGFYGAFRTRANQPPPITQANAAFHRSVVGDVARWSQEGSWEDVIHGRLHAAGHRFRLVPAATIRQNEIYGLWSYCRDRFDHGRDYASIRTGSLSRWRRLAFLAGTPALPLLLAGRIIRSVHADERPYLSRGLPAMLTFLTAWSIGEAAGYARGSAR
jgi:glycosyltransferase involved in cell wall biosynthesis